MNCSNCNRYNCKLWRRKGDSNRPQFFCVYCLHELHNIDFDTINKKILNNHPNDYELCIDHTQPFVPAIANYNTLNGDLDICTDAIYPNIVWQTWTKLPLITEDYKYNIKTLTPPLHCPSLNCNCCNGFDCKLWRRRGDFKLLEVKFICSHCIIKFYNTPKWSQRNHAYYIDGGELIPVVMNYSVGLCTEPFPLDTLEEWLKLPLEPSFYYFKLPTLIS